MKKYILFLIIYSCHNSYSQPIHSMLGLNISNYDFTYIGSDMFNGNMIGHVYDKDYVGYSVGLGVEYFESEYISTISLFQFNQLGSNIQSGSIVDIIIKPYGFNRTIEFQDLSLSQLVKFTPLKMGDFKCNIYLGPKLNTIIANSNYNSVTRDKTLFNDHIHSLTLNTTMGIGLEYSLRARYSLYLNSFYNIALNNAVNFKNENPSIYSNFKQEGSLKYFQILVGISYNLKNQ